MAIIIVGSETEAIEVARDLHRAAESVRHNPLLHDIEQICLVDKLCGLRDAIKIEKQRTHEEILQDIDDHAFDDEYN